MSHVVIVSSEPLGRSAGGITTFIDHFGTLLLDRGDRLTWLIADPSGNPAHPPEVRLESRGARVIAIQPARTGVRVFGSPPAALASAASVADAIPADADIVYSQDWGAQAFTAVRRRRLLGLPACPIVTVMHGASEWVRWGMQVFPQSLDHDATLAFAERYAVEHSDFVAAPSDAMRRWLLARGWRLDDKTTAVVGYPFAGRLGPAPERPTAPATEFRRLIYFGRLQTVKGLEFFVEAIQSLGRRGLLSDLDEVVFLGGEAQNRLGSAADVVRAVERAGVAARALTGLDSRGAQAVLAEHAADALVVVPSLIENFPYAVIEASLVPGLNLLCSRVGGIPEILGGNDVQLFEPDVEALADGIAGRLAEGPLGQDCLVTYDADAANARWLALHDRALELGRHSASPRPSAVASIGPGAPPTADVCVVHRDEPAVAQLLESLARQTSDRFGVVVVDDGSARHSSLARLEELERQYAPRGWRFLRRAYEDVGAAWNAAAATSSADFLLFADAHDVLAPACIERLVNAAARSSVDCLSSHALVFDGSDYPLDAEGRPLRQPIELVVPPGGPLATALVANPYGVSTCLVRRDAFESIGGFSEDRWIGREDYELYVRLVLAGRSVDVVPEPLVHHRRRPGRAGDAFRSHERILRAFRTALAAKGLAELPEAVCGLFPPVAPDIDSPAVRARRASLSDLQRVATRVRVARLGRPRVATSPAWPEARAVADVTSWRVLSGALVVKAKRRLS